MFCTQTTCIYVPLCVPQYIYTYTYVYIERDWKGGAMIYEGVIRVVGACVHVGITSALRAELS